jgi:hypothetical protein
MIHAVEPESSSLGKPCSEIFGNFFIEKPSRLSNRQPTNLSKKRSTARRSDDLDEDQGIPSQHARMNIAINQML